MAAPTAIPAMGADPSTAGPALIPAPPASALIPAPPAPAPPAPAPPADALVAAAGPGPAQPRPSTNGYGVHVYVLATRHTAGSRNMVNALRYLGFRFTVLAEGQAFRGFRWRSAQYRDAAAAHGNPNELLVFVDAYDALPLRSPRGLREAFDAMADSEATVVVGGETGCALLNCGRVGAWWDSAEKYNRAQRGQAVARHVNGGFVAGRAAAVARAYDWIVARGYADDQRGMTAYLNTVGPHAAMLDHRATLVQNWHIGEAVRARPWGSAGPWFIHFPGSRAGINKTPYNALAAEVLQDADAAAERVAPHMASRDVLLLVCTVAAALLLLAASAAAWARMRRRAG
jgi:hypothetical protein